MLSWFPAHQNYSLVKDIDSPSTWEKKKILDKQRTQVLSLDLGNDCSA